MTTEGIRGCSAEQVQTACRNQKATTSYRNHLIEVLCCRLLSKMLLLEFFVALTCFNAVYFTTEAANIHPTTTKSRLHGLPGRDEQLRPVGHDSIAGPAGGDGLDGLPGPCCTLTYTEQQQLKEDILEMLLKEISTMNLCNTSNPSTHQSLQRTTSPIH